MVAQDIVSVIQSYLRAVADKGIPVRYGVLYGSYAKGRAHKWSDIDLLVISPAYDRKLTHKQVSKLWRIAAHTDSRIEPIPVGERQYKEDDSSLIIEVARREGQIITFAE
jgi:uncharacterized protein